MEETARLILLLSEMLRGRRVQGSNQAKLGDGVVSIWCGERLEEEERRGS